MATQGMAQPSAKKRSFILRDLFKLCRSISSVLPREKLKHHHHHIHKAKHVTNESKRVDEEPKRNKPNAFKVQETKGTGDNNDVEGVGLCKVRSYRYVNTNTNFVGNKKRSSLSRSCSHNTATDTSTNSTLRSLSYVGRNNRMTESGRFMPTLMRSSTTVPRSFANQILYSTSSARVAKPSPTEKKLRCTLEELCNGCTKKIKFKRDVITSSGQMCEEEEMVEIKVKPGWKGGTRLTFEGKGNEAMGSTVPADLIFVIVEKEHEVFQREGDDLEMAVEVSLVEALTGCELSVALLDGDNMSLRIEDVIYPGYVTVVQGKGMPKLKEKGKRGDLRVRFQTKFPQQLTDEQRAEIHSILEDSS
ncbi:PREDICTED: dnaJ homolog subfamily B member 11 [Camelina sativa]|uniref:DnaJ homolog subfamily B member 11 n=1 Tax=Camelina sativa TaxID=90675 RepID=A0ABM0X115_CAMSA|nr:PREDICTED: dnaJ homolog subfamily B member 11 [Camelina sativa]